MPGLVQSLLRIIATLIVFAALATFAFRQPSFTSSPYVWAERASPRALRAHVGYLTTVARPRCSEHAETLDRTATYIHDAFARAGGRTADQVFVARGRRYRNVTVAFGPPTGDPMIVGAHYDAFCATGDLPGADDNASGTAGLLELARLLGAHPPRQRVQLVAFANEEPPFFGSDEMGSAIHARSLAGSSVRGMICLEMIGYFRGAQSWPSPILSALYPRSGTFIAVAGGWADRDLLGQVKSAIRGAGGVDVYSFTGPRPMLDGSDHVNYWERGFRAVVVTDTAFLRNPHYHTGNDTSDTLDYARMAAVIDGVFSAVDQ